MTRRSLSRSPLRAVVLAAGVVLLSVTAAAATSSSIVPSWHLTKVLHLPSWTMSGVACTSTSHCVGTMLNGKIIETSTSWHTDVLRQGHASAHAADVMSAVTCPSSTRCEAVGGWGTATTGYGIIDGSINGGQSWGAQHPAVATGPWPVYAISCTSTSSCIAAGVKGGHTSYWTRTTTSGASWTDHIGGIAPSVGGLGAISCVVGGFCAVLGTIHTSASTGDSGASWKVGTVPADVRYFWGLSCFHQDIEVCVAVGMSTTNEGLALRSTDGGLFWTAMSVPPIARTLYGVTCLSPVECYAVGRTGSTDTNGHALVLRTTDGHTWTVSLNSAHGSVLQGIACLSASWCTVVGGDKSSHAVIFTLH
jgi:hypothetical protein